MDYLISLLISYGYWGMLVTAFVAGSFFPFSSEAVMTGLLAAGLDPWLLIVYGTIGNVAGGDRATKFMAGRGARMGFFAFVPILGSAITVALGLMRANIPISLTSMAIGKFLRYVALIYGASLLI